MRHNNPFNPINRQRGNTLVIAVFVIVVLGGLVAALASLLRTSSESVVIEVLGARSYLAAQSGLEQAMMTVYPLDTAPDTSCDVDGTEYSFAGNQGLEQCSATISCDNENYTDQSNTIYTHLVVTADGICTAGSQQASRQLQIETRIEN
ncbi:Type II secretory pathway component [Idiomarina sp. UBA4520]|jgi:MSHA biogenesis protein MshP|uniref:Type II secretory pathway component n=1 Tax=Idiomarina sp. UBA4520 TaxID=1946647 RepID=UPI000AAB5B11|nr:MULTISPECIES: Type II secretory pathway component [unclassified Idiomarina]MBF39690.1 Type II secretory pathway component [Idiomarinaceae bacterium]|tara:strand:+ start:21050 stop:21496 length:447 start_codon:yes stop_codon:yes gene_type:complete